MGSAEFSSGLKRPWHETDHSPQVHDEVKNEWRCISTSYTYLQGMNKDNFTFLPTAWKCQVKPVTSNKVQTWPPSWPESCL